MHSCNACHRTVTVLVSIYALSKQPRFRRFSVRHEVARLRRSCRHKRHQRLVRSMAYTHAQATETAIELATQHTNIEHDACSVTV